MDRPDEKTIELSTRKVIIAFVAIVLSLCGVGAYIGGSVSGALLLWFLVGLCLGGHLLLKPEEAEEDEPEDTSSAVESPSENDESKPEKYIDNATNRSADTDYTTDDALTELRQRYAHGEVSEEQFEHRLERLLASDDGGDAAVAALRHRYATCELTDEQFERKYAQLRATNTVENAEDSFSPPETTSEGE
ncbi:Short C-terminal domain-containing protein [Haladaptatus litoreus]|uniref:Short C-terminal domain-containing protein n=1 Tax=Haladaptatus litoreus TaxID=553468 RepID=A0A1N6Z5V2_9EURY|nr:SHOCT domain-containing protein [Haladaptatus litoreus]SIR22131.1 Short C-terminal domain-containing protein [Haladaptatus litoreus]